MNTRVYWGIFSLGMTCYESTFAFISLDRSERAMFEVRGRNQHAKEEFEKVHILACELQRAHLWHFYFTILLVFTLHDVTKIQTTKLLILLIFYFNDA